MKIITEGIPEGNEVLLEKIVCVYTQQPDCVSSEDDWQELTLETRDGGGGNFINVKTNECGWSISDAEDLKLIIDDFNKRMNEYTNNS